MTHASNSSKLALIYSRLAELELQKEKRGDVWEEITKNFGAGNLDPAEIHNIEDIFHDTLYGTTDDGFKGPKALDAESVSRVRLLFLAEEQFSESLHHSVSEKLNKIKAYRSQRDGYASEVFRMREEMLTQDSRLRDLEELCRSLQRLGKEKDEQRSSMIEQEREKTQHLERECVQSIDAVGKKIAEEEAELDLKSLENEELQAKLEQFTQHLQLRKEKMKNEERAKELQNKLEDARRAQLEYNKAQEKLRGESLKSKVRHLEESVHALQQQLGMYTGKFEEFDETLNRSFVILRKVDERVEQLEGMVRTLVQENEGMKAQATEADVSLIKAMESKKRLEDELSHTKSMQEKYEKKLRRLLHKRQELMKSKGEGEGGKGTGAKGMESDPGSGTPLSKAVEQEESSPSSLPPVSPSPNPAPSSSSAPSTPNRKPKPPFLSSPAPASSSSMMSSPSRGVKAGGESEELVGEGSPVSSPKSSSSSSRKK